MKHAEHPALIYDFAPVASLLGKYNTQGYAYAPEKLDEALDKALLEIETSDKPPVPHTDPELIKGVQSFLFKTVITILNEAGDKVPQHLQLRVTGGVRKLNESISELQPQKKMLCSINEIEKMFGLDMCEDKLRRVADEENKIGKLWLPPIKIAALHEPIKIEEIRNISEVVRKKILKTANSSPDFYLDRPERHHLFWSPTEVGEQCIIPFEYSMADFLRFHCPHNDAHLVHLHSLPQQSIISYCDYMDERAFTEAVAVYAENQMLEASLEDSFMRDLHAQFSESRQKGITYEQLQEWLLHCRGYEFHLRSVRLLGDLYTLYSRQSFDNAVAKAISFTGISKKDIEAEMIKYYHFPGLGATYTLGFRQLQDLGITSFEDTFTHNNQIITTWHTYNF